MNSKLVKLFRLKRNLMKASELLLKERGYLNIHRIADDELEVLSKKLRRKFKALTYIRELSNEDLQDLWRALDLDFFIEDIVQTIEESIWNVLEEGYQEGVAAMKRSKVSDDVGGYAGFVFARTPRLEAYVSGIVHEFRGNFIKDLRFSLDAVLKNPLMYGTTPQDIAASLRPLLGLNRPDQKWLLKYREQLLRHGLHVEEIPQFVQTASEVRLEERIADIGKTETIDGAVFGQQEAWVQAKAVGFFTEAWFEEWVVTPDDRLCPFCAAMEGQTADIGGKFTTPDGKKISGPGLHPRCRCSVRLTQ